MKLYVYSNPTNPTPGLLGQLTEDLAEMVHGGLLTPTCTVWCNLTKDAAALWVLTDQLRFIYTLPVVGDPGYLRVTQSTVRWGRSRNESLKSPLTVPLPTDLGDVPVIVRVVHRCGGKQITVVDGQDNRLLHPDDHGGVTLGGVTVVDWVAYKPSGSVGEPGILAQSEALARGTHWLIDGADEAARTAIIADPEVLAITLDGEALAGALSFRKQMHGWSAGQLAGVVGRLPKVEKEKVAETAAA